MRAGCRFGERSSWCWCWCRTSVGRRRGVPDHEPVAAATTRCTRVGPIQQLEYPVYGRVAGVRRVGRAIRAAGAVLVRKAGRGDGTRRVCGVPGEAVTGLTGRSEVDRSVPVPVPGARCPVPGGVAGVWRAGAAGGEESSAHAAGAWASLGVKVGWVSRGEATSRCRLLARGGDRCCTRYRSPTLTRTRCGGKVRFKGCRRARNAESSDLGVAWSGLEGASGPEGASARRLRIALTEQFGPSECCDGSFRRPGWHYRDMSTNC